MRNPLYIGKIVNTVSNFTQVHIEQKVGRGFLSRHNDKLSSKRLGNPRPTVSIIERFTLPFYASFLPFLTPITTAATIISRSNA